MEEKAVEEEELKPSLFPLLPVVDPHPPTTTSANPSLPQWLCNSSFTTDVSVINDAVSSQLQRQQPEEDEEEEDDPSNVRTLPEEPSRVYEQLESSESDGNLESESRRSRKKKKSGKKRKRLRSSEKGGEFGGAFGSRKSDVRVWADSETRPAKDYYFDTRGDRDNLVFGCLYRYWCQSVSFRILLSISSCLLAEKP